PGADVDALDQFGRVADLEDLALAGLVDGDAFAAGGERLARAVLVPDPAQVGAAHRDVGLVAPDEALVLHGAAELHPGVGLRAEDAEAEPEVEVADRPALPDDELIGGRQVLGGGFAGDGAVLDREVAHVGRLPALERLAVEDRAEAGLALDRALGGAGGQEKYYQRQARGRPHGEIRQRFRSSVKKAQRGVPFPG